MQKSIILIGAGEMGSVFARGFLKTGYSVIPALRDTDLKQLATECPEPEMVLVAVAENDLQDVLSNIPTAWQTRLVLLQNELLPRDWQRNKINNPTIISVWFEKKPGQDFKVLISSPCYGPQASLLKTALNSLTIDCHVVKDEQELVFELVVKNVYILTTNIAGLRVGGTVESLWNDHQDFARTVADEVIDIQEYLVGKKFDRELLIDGMKHAIEGDLNHNCMGRSAPGRLQRALAIAKDAGLTVLVLKELSR